MHNLAPISLNYLIIGGLWHPWPIHCQARFLLLYITVHVNSLFVLILILPQVVSWGLKGKDKVAFRPAMALSSGELSALSGSLLLMTATATSKTIRLLMDQLPEVRKWNFILNSPIREGITIIVPPPEVISPKFEVSLLPFVSRMKLQGEIYLILVRGIVIIAW